MASMQFEKHLQLQRNAYMTNKTQSKVRLDRFKNFGKDGPGTLPPATIKADEVGKIIQFSAKAAVIYSGHNAKQWPTAWLVAWDSTRETNLPPGRNKVFVACGLKAVIDKMTDDEILQFLNDAKSPKDDATDSITKTTVSADLSEQLIPIGFRLDATFGLV